MSRNPATDDASRTVDHSSREDATSWTERQLAGCAMQRVRIDALVRADSPRLHGVQEDHVRLLAEMDGTPPIVVHRQSMRVIDGMHRLRAAELRGDTTITVRLYDGDLENAYVLAVSSNTTHGLPLSLADRKNAAARIVLSHPQWSDRMVAVMSGLAPTTVGAIRHRAGPECVEPTGRVGRDGRLRPVDSEAARRLAGELMAKDPTASLRQVARAAGVSPSTVHDVRKRVEAGQAPVPASRATDADMTILSERQSSEGRGLTATARAAEWDEAAATRRLRDDPSVRFGDAGRRLLRWLGAAPPKKGEGDQVVENLPAHCLNLAAQFARNHAAAWGEFAEKLERRAARLLADGVER